MYYVEIDAEYITLQQFLKAADIISSGGMAKHYLAESLVLVNDQPENRRGRKLYPNDVIVIDGYDPFTITPLQK
ncbi:MAG: S4 domain-containing protein YaaA [Culicoidibacterales bacterium]